MTGQSPRQRGTSPRQRGTNPRATNTNPRAVTRDDLTRLEAKIDRALALLEHLAGQQPAAAPTQAVHDPERGMFLPGTGWVSYDDGQTHEPLEGTDR
jgi:hypothetical protein